MNTATKKLNTIAALASSTNMPIENISANRLTRLIERPMMRAANTVSIMAVGITMAVTPASRQAIAKPIRTTIDAVVSAR